MPQDPIKGLLAKYFAQFGLTPAAADATAVARKMPYRPVMKAAGPEIPHQIPTPLGSAAELNPIKRVSPFDVLDMLTRLRTAGKAGYSLGQGLHDKDLGEVAGALIAALPAMIPAESKVARALLPERWAVLTAENPFGREASAAENATHMANARQFLNSLGMVEGEHYIPVSGGYKDETTGQVLRENGFLLRGAKPGLAEYLGRHFNQNSVVTHRGLHNLVDNTLIPSKAIVAATEDSPAFTILPNGKGFAHELDWDNPIPLNQVRPEETVKGPVLKTQTADKPTFAADSTVAHSPLAKALLDKSPYAWEYGMLLHDPEVTKVTTPMTPTEMANVVAYHDARQNPLRLPLQHDILRPVGPRIPQDRLAAIEDEAYKTYSGPAFEKLLQEGNFPDFYNTVRTQGRAIDALGDVEGPEAFRDLAQKMAATTARSAPPNNLRRASYYRALDLAGLLNPADLRAGAYKDVPTLMGHIANDAHHAALATQVETGSIDPLANPKPASFMEDLLRNFRPFTNDTRMATGAAKINPRLVEMGALRPAVSREGTVSYSPRSWAYAPMELGFQRAANDYAGRGLLDQFLPPGADPTAFAQAKIWDALGPMLGGSRSAGTFDDIFDQKLAENAAAWKKSQDEANRLFWQGHPFDLPLNSDIIPRRVNEGLIQIP